MKYRVPIVIGSLLNLILIHSPAWGIGSGRTDLRTDIFESPTLRVTEPGFPADLEIFCGPEEAQDFYDAVVQDLALALSTGTLSDPRILDFLESEEDLFSSDCQALVDVLVVDGLEPASEDSEHFLASFSNSAAVSRAAPSSGTVSGPRHPFHNIFGWEIGSGKITITWGKNGQCHIEITGFTFVGSIPLGNCTASQIGHTATESCPPTEECEEATRECGHYQFKCQQWFRFRNLGIFTSRVQKICAPCP